MRASSRRWFRQFNTRDVEAVQRVSITVNSGTLSGSVTPTPLVDWTRTEIQIAGWINTTGGGTGQGNKDQSFYLDVNGNDLRMTRNHATDGGNSTVFVDLVTYRPGVMKRIQRGTIVNAGTGTGTSALASKVVIGKAVARFLGAASNSNANSTWPGRVELQDEATVKYLGADGVTTNTASFEVVEKY